MRSTPPVAVATVPLALLAIAGCGGSAPTPTTATRRAVGTPLLTRPAALPASAALEPVRVTVGSRRLLAYAEPARVARVAASVGDAPTVAAALTGEPVDAGARAVVRAGGSLSRGPAARAGDGVLALGGVGQVQGCLGDVVASTLLGPDSGAVSVGGVAAAGLARTDDRGAPSVAVCASTPLESDGDRLAPAVLRRAKALGAGRVEGFDLTDLGERGQVQLVLRPRGATQVRRALELLRGGRALRALVRLPRAT